MKLIKRIIYSLLGLLMVLTVGMVALILYAEYSGKPFSLRSGASQEDSMYQEEASRLVLDETDPQAEPSATDAVTADVPAPDAAADPAPDTAADSAAPAEPTEPAATPAPAAAEPGADAAASTTYAMNKESAIFHKPDCPLVAEISTDNYSTMTGIRDDVVGRGYDPCTSCNP